MKVFFSVVAGVSASFNNMQGPPGIGRPPMPQAGVAQEQTNMNHQQYQQEMMQQQGGLSQGDFLKDLHAILYETATLGYAEPGFVYQMPINGCASVSGFSLATKSQALNEVMALMDGMERDGRFSPFYIQRGQALMGAMFQVNAALFRMMPDCITGILRQQMTLLFNDYNSLYEVRFHQNYQILILMNMSSRLQDSIDLNCLHF